jgi:hypothetical protein
MGSKNALTGSQSTESLSGSRPGASTNLWTEPEPHVEIFAAHIAPDDQQVYEVLLKMLDRWNAHDIEGYMEVYWN